MNKFLIIIGKPGYNIVGSLWFTELSAAKEEGIRFVERGHVVSLEHWIGAEPCCIKNLNTREFQMYWWNKEFDRNLNSW